MSDPHDPDNRENETRKKALMGDVKLPRPDEKTEPGGNEENEKKPHSPVPPLMGVPLGPDEKKEPGDNEENEEKTHFPFLAGMGLFAPIFPFLPKKKKK